MRGRDLEKKTREPTDEQTHTEVRKIESNRSNQKAEEEKRIQKDIKKLKENLAHG